MGIFFLIDLHINSTLQAKTQFWQNFDLVRSCSKPTICTIAVELNAQQVFLSHKFTRREIHATFPWRKPVIQPSQLKVKKIFIFQHIFINQHMSFFFVYRFCLFFNSKLCPANLYLECSGRGCNGKAEGLGDGSPPAGSRGSAPRSYWYNVILCL